MIGYPLEHSFSKKYFTEKFSLEKINETSYENFELENIDQFPELVKSHPQLRGLNVTIPYKESVIQYLDELNTDADKIGAVNTIKISSGKLIGYNTDHVGFTRTLAPLLKSHHKHALVLGTGGASKGVRFSLEKLDIKYQMVSRAKGKNNITYDEVNQELLEKYNLIVNTTPVGMSPNKDAAPDLSYEAITSDHLLYDLIYNPEETLFLKKGKERGANTKNGYEMLVLQAEEGWRIWNSF